MLILPKQEEATTANENKHKKQPYKTQHKEQTQIKQIIHTSTHRNRTKTNKQTKQTMEYFACNKNAFVTPTHTRTHCKSKTKRIQKITTNKLKKQKTKQKNKTKQNSILPKQKTNKQPPPNQPQQTNNHISTSYAFTKHSETFNK